MRYLFGFFATLLSLHSISQVDYMMNSNIGNLNDVNDNFGFNVTVDISNVGNSDGDNDIWILLVLSADLEYQPESDYCFHRFLDFSGIDVGFPEQFYFNSSTLFFEPEDFGVSPGSYNILCVIDHGLDQVESNENNNVFLVDDFVLTTGTPNPVYDYVVEDIALNSNCVVAGEDILLEMIVTNIGGVDADFTTQTKVLFSEDNNPSLSDEQLYTWLATPALESSESFTDDAIIQIPGWVEPGESYFVIVHAAWFGTIGLGESAFLCDDWLSIEVFVPEPIQFPDDDYVVVEEVECGVFEVDFFAPFCQDCSYSWTFFDSFGNVLGQSTDQNTTFNIPLGGYAGSNTFSECNAETFAQEVIPTLDSTCGCTDDSACNYDPFALMDDDSCTYPGCTDSESCTYEPNAGCDDGSCDYFDECGECGGDGTIGCTNLSACNYDPDADCDDGSCLTEYGCTDDSACNFESTATCEDGSCDYSCLGCTDELACNYEMDATVDDSTCEYFSCLDFVTSLTYEEFCDSTCVTLEITEWYPEWATVDVYFDAEPLLFGVDTLTEFKVYGAGEVMIDVVTTLSDLQQIPTLVYQESVPTMGEQQPVISESGNEVSCDNCSGNLDYFWYLDGTEVGTTEVLGLESSGWVTLVIVNTDTGCSAESEALEFMYVGLGSHSMQNPLVVIGNGTAHPRLVWSGNSSERIVVVDVQGRVILEGSMKKTQAQISALPIGLYIVLIRNVRRRILKM